MKVGTAVILSGSALGLIALAIVNPIVVIGPGNVGVMNTFGSISKEPLKEGLHFRLPWQGVETITCRLITHVDQNVGAASKDLQTVKTEITVPFSINPETAADMFQKIGNIGAINASVLTPGVLEATKAVTARYTAEELIVKREVVKNEVEEHIHAYVDNALKAKGVAGAVTLGTVAITHFEFTKDFNDAIEAKVKAEQDALRAENQKRQKITEAEALAESAKKAADGEAYAIEKKSTAEATAIRRRADALNQNPKLIQLNAVEKWNGVLPVTMTGSAPVPFIEVK